MKIQPYLYSIVFLLISHLAFSQQPQTSWIYQTEYSNVRVDSIKKKEVHVRINLSVIPDSAVIIIKAGTTLGGDDLYLQKIPKWQLKKPGPGMAFEQGGKVLNVNIGRYKVKRERFFVDADYKVKRTIDHKKKREFEERKKKRNEEMKMLSQPVVQQNNDSIKGQSTTK